LTERFFPAKNASITVSVHTEGVSAEPVGGSGVVNLHSIYNPENEAARFVQNLPDGVYRYIVVTGPALSYCAPFFRKRFPNSYLMAIQFSPAFAHTDSLWNRVFLFEDSELLAEGLFSVIGEEEMSSTLFVSWKPSETAYPVQYAETWNAIAKAVRKGRDVLGTRCFFNKRWSLNAVQFCIGLKNAAVLRPGTTSILIAAAGPTLECSFGFLKQNRDSLYIMALSSALLPLLSAGIIPDCCVSTDGGYWAKHHLLPLCADGAPDVPVLLSAESALPSELFERQQVIPLCYGDVPEALLLEASGIPALQARRNGTVAGTAAELALSLTSGNVYALGLDLSDALGRNHARPNMLDAVRARYTNRLCPLGSGEISNQGALDIYARWFASRGSSPGSDFSKRFFRVKPVPCSIPSLREVEWDAVLMSTSTAPCLSAADIPSQEQRRSAIRSLIAVEAARFSKGSPEQWLSGKAALWAAAGALPQFLKLKKTGNAEALQTEMAAYFAVLDERAARYDR
jgi:hypothetical protein